MVIRPEDSKTTVKYGCSGPRLVLSMLQASIQRTEVSILHALYQLIEIHSNNYGFRCVRLHDRLRGGQTRQPKHGFHSHRQYVVSPVPGPTKPSQTRSPCAHHVPSLAMSQNRACQRSTQHAQERCTRTAQLLYNLVRNPLLEVHLAINIARRSGRTALRLGTPCGDTETGCVERGLSGVSSQYVEQDLDVTLWLLEKYKYVQANVRVRVG